MAKRKITVTVDEEIVDLIRSEGAENLSAVVNRALREYADRLDRRIGLRELLDEWDERLGPIPEEHLAWARAAFDELDGPVVDEITYSQLLERAAKDHVA